MQTCCEKMDDANAVYKEESQIQMTKTQRILFMISQIVICL